MLYLKRDSILNNVNMLRGSSFRQVGGFFASQPTGSSAMNPAKLPKRQRAGFTMIELIFSIVIVGLVILSIPLIVRQSNLNTAMSQNVIGYYNALTLMETIKSKPWDKSNVADFISSGEYYILDTNDPNGYNCQTIPITMNVLEYNQTTNKQEWQKKSITGNTRSKKGLSLANKRRMCDPQTKKASAIATNNALESINDFHNYEVAVYSDIDSNQQIFKLQVAVDYVSVDFGNGVNDPKVVGKINNLAGNTSDVKRIRITLIRMLDNQEIDKDGEAVFTYYAANIGSDIPLVKDNTKNPNVNP